VACLAESALGERKHLCGLHDEDQDYVAPTLVAEAALVNLVVPPFVPLRRP
jgi:hypothetical protein